MAFERTLHKVVVRKGLVPPTSNAVDCVAPGPESSCKDDFDKIKPLKKPGKIVVGCGGLAIAAFYTLGEAYPTAAALSGGMTCGWGVAIENW